MKQISRAFLVVFFSVFVAFSVRAADITVAADVWCPFNCEPGSEQPGLMIEIAQEAFAEEGHTLNYVEMNWSRAIQEARKGHINGIVGAFHGDAPDFIYPEQELAVLGNTFFVRRDAAWEYKGVESLKQIQLAAIGGYDYGDELRDYIQKSGSESVTLLGGSDHPLKRGIQMLHLKRIDAIVEADPVFWYTAKLLNKSDQFKVAGRASEPMKSFIAFSPALEESKAYAEILTRGIEKLRKNGELSRILSKYGLTDWR